MWRAGRLFKGSGGGPAARTGAAKARSPARLASRIAVTIVPPRRRSGATSGPATEAGPSGSRRISAPSARVFCLKRLACAFYKTPSGGMAEWFKAHAWNACIRETVSWVRIPLPPPASETRISLAAQFGRRRAAHRGFIARKAHHHGALARLRRRRQRRLGHAVGHDLRRSRQQPRPARSAQRQHDPDRSLHLRRARACRAHHAEHGAGRHQALRLRPLRPPHTEATETGAFLREYIWLDDLPLAVEADLDTQARSYSSCTPITSTARSR